MTIPSHHPRRTRRLLAALLALPLLLPLASLAPADAKPGSPPGAAHAAAPARTATVMTRNLYLGASLDGIIAALVTGDPTKVIGAATETWQTVQASDPAERMAAVADEIVAAKPAAVGLQEVTQWSTYAFNPQTQQVVGGPTVAYDFLQLLLDALAARGESYHAVSGATSTNFTSDPIPVLVGPYPTQAVQLLDRDVIIVRDGVKATNAHHGNFSDQAILSLPRPGQDPLPVDRGWGSADLRTRLASFRFVNAHTEAGTATIDAEALRVAEVGELFAAQQQIAEETGALPTVYVGDYNSPAPDAGAYELLTSQLSDLWLATHPGQPDPNPGSLTCCFGDKLDDPTNPLETRIDLILGTAGVRALSTYRVGDRPVDLPGDTWWASDHAGVVGTVVIG